ncbi:MAG: YbaN family protein [Acetobacterium sp.]|uniref:YbaN family protein n=1 Tax=Acetobacterium sp. TaxID=1872094 RepID=UPI003242C01A
MKIKKGFYLILGCLSLALGAIGAILPMLPCAPFLLLAAFCFTKSSDRLHAWFMQTKLYQNNLESLVKGQGMTKKAKLRIISIVTITMLFGFIMMRATTIGRVVLIFVWICHLLYFVFGVKTMDEKDLVNDNKSQTM